MRNYISAQGWSSPSSPIQLMATYSSLFLWEGHRKGSFYSPPPTPPSLWLLFQIINLMCWGFCGLVTRQLQPSSSLPNPRKAFNYCAAFIIKVAYDTACRLVGVASWERDWESAAWLTQAKGGQKEEEQQAAHSALWSPKMLAAFNLKCTWLVLIKSRLELAKKKAGETGKK